MHRSFSLKGPNPFSAVLAAGLVLTLGGTLSAQAPSNWRVSPEPNNSRRGIEAPPKQPDVIVIQETADFDRRGGGGRRQPTLFVIPAMVTSDGTVLANFGMGLEPVTRSCGGTMVTSRSRVVGSNGRVLTEPNYTQPVPNQATASQQMSYRVLTAASQTACFTTDGSGRFFVVRQ